MQPRLRLAYPGTRIDEETSEIVIIDNGIGMSDKDVRIKYLRIGRDRRGKTYKSVYGRMEWDEPSPTITTQFHNFGCGRFGHPEQHRALSFREAALLQTFPPDYDFVDPDQPVTITNIGAYIAC